MSVDQGFPFVAEAMVASCVQPERQRMRAHRQVAWCLAQLQRLSARLPADANCLCRASGRALHARAAGRCLAVTHGFRLPVGRSGMAKARRSAKRLKCASCGRLKCQRQFGAFAWSHSHRCLVCSRAEWKASVAAPQQRQAALRRWGSKPNPRGFGLLRKVSRGCSVPLATPSAIAVVLFTYFANAALHRQAGILSIRLCLRQLRCQMGKGRWPEGTLLVGFAAKAPQAAARALGLPGHSNEEWPSERLLCVAPVHEHMPVRAFMQRFPRRTDAAIYRRVSATGGQGVTNWKLTGKAEARNPFRGQGARKRLAGFYKARPEIMRRQRRSGLSLDRWIERNHRLKDMSGDALVCRRYLLGLSDGALGPAPPCTSAVSRLLKARFRAATARAALPVKLTEQHTPRAFAEVLALARAAWATA